MANIRDEDLGLLVRAQLRQTLEDPSPANRRTLAKLRKMALHRKWRGLAGRIDAALEELASNAKSAP